jgi:outer membrane protein assembly factor BamB
VTQAPTAGGGVEWPDPAWDPTNKVEVVCANVTSTGVESPPAPDQHPVITNVGQVIAYKSSTPTTALSIARLVAFDPSTNKIVWKHDAVSTGGIGAGNSAPCSSPVTITAGGIALIGQIVPQSGSPLPGGVIQAFDIKTGSLDWQVPVTINGSALPVVPRLTPYAINGKEYLAAYQSGALGPQISVYALP